MSTYVAAYDIANTARRTRVAQILSQYGRRVQRSVFEVWLEPEELKVLRRRVGPLLDPKDEFDLFPVDLRNLSRRIKWQRSPSPHQRVILIGPG